MINFFPLNDEDILQRWTIDELDMLHDISGYGENWQQSECRGRLKLLAEKRQGPPDPEWHGLDDMLAEEAELEHLQNIIGEIHVSMKVSACYSQKVVQVAVNQNEKRILVRCQLVEHTAALLHYHQLAGVPDIYWRWR